MNTRRVRFWVFVAGMFLAGLCIVRFYPAATLSDVDRISEGMTTQEVSAILGGHMFRLGLGDEEEPGYSLHYDLRDGIASVEYGIDDKVRRIRWKGKSGILSQWVNRVMR